MRTFGKMVLALGVVVVLVAPAQAQQRGGGFGRFGGGFGGSMLLTNKGVQQELKVTEAQATKLETLSQEIREKYGNQGDKIRDLPEDQRAAKMREMSEAINADMRAGLNEILKPAQVKRFRQIQIQQEGLRAFANPQVQEALKLTDDQKSRINTIEEEQRSAMREIFQGASDDREGAMKKMADLRKQGNEKALAVLTDEQKTTWKDLIGAPFEVRFEGRGRNN